MPTKREIEEIDRIVDEVLRNPESAQRLKSALHGDFARQSQTPAPTVGTTDSADEDGDDLWDNLPI